MTLKKKLWITWGVLAVTAVLGLAAGASSVFIWTATIVAAAAGWAAFLLPD